MTDRNKVTPTRMPRLLDGRLDLGQEPLTVRDHYKVIRLKMTMLEGQLKELQASCEHTFAEHSLRGEWRCADCGKAGNIRDAL